MPRLRIPPLFLNILLFASVGILLGAVLCFGMLATFHDDPRAALVIFWVPGEAMSAAFYFGGAPAVVTGLVAALLRYYVQRLQVLAIVMAPIGAVIAGIYVALIGVRSGGYPLIGMLSLAGGVSALQHIIAGVQASLDHLRPPFGRHRNQ